MDETLTIGQVAAEVGLNTSAIRFYESVGVLPEPERVGGQRRYGRETVRRLQVLDVAKRAGFTLDEAKLLLGSTDAGAPAHEQLRNLAARKLPEVDALIAQAQAMRAWLTTASGCRCETLDVCRLFAAEETAANTATADRLVELSITHACGPAGRSPDPG